MNDVKQLEMFVSEMIKAYGVQTPPVPIEAILQNPKDDMWEKVDISQLSGSFLSLKHKYSPRMSLARMLARHIIVSEWGQAQRIQELVQDHDEEAIHGLARMLIMPAFMLDDLTISERNPTTMSMQFEVPEEDARLRLEGWM